MIIVGASRDLESRKKSPNWNYLIQYNFLRMFVGIATAKNNSSKQNQSSATKQTKHTFYLRVVYSMLFGMLRSLVGSFVRWFARSYCSLYFLALFTLRTIHHIYWEIMVKDYTIWILLFTIENPPVLIR